MGRLSRIIGAGVGCNHKGPFKKKAKGGLLQKEDNVRQGKQTEGMCFEFAGRSYKPKETDSPLSASRTMRINLRCFKILKVYHALSQWQ